MSRTRKTSNKDTLVVAQDYFLLGQSNLLLVIDENNLSDKVKRLLKWILLDKLYTVKYVFPALLDFIEI